MRDRLMTLAVTALLAGSAWAAPAPQTPQAPGVGIVAQPPFGDVFREASSLAATFDGIRIAGCRLGEAPICSRWETTYEPYCEQWEFRDGGTLCRKWLYTAVETCKAWACGADH